jgi:hypothetical protein
MANRGRAPGFKMPEEHRSKIRTTQLLNRLELCALGEVIMTPEQIRATEICLRKALPDLSAVEMAVETQQPFALLPSVLEDQDAWQDTFKPKH